MPPLEQFVRDMVLFVNNYIIPFLIGIAFLLFVINAIRFFVLGAGSQESREKARSLALYGVLAMVFLLLFWGLVNILAGSSGLVEGAYGNPPTFDY